MPTVYETAGCGGRRTANTGASPSSYTADTYTRAEGLAEDSVYSVYLAEDKYGWLWLSTSNHLLRVKRDKLRTPDLVP